MTRPTLDEISDLLAFDFDGGRLFWRNPPKEHPGLRGREAGNPQAGRGGKTYWVVKINGKKVKRAHIIFAFANGHWPVDCTDHIDGNSLNDRPENLRDATVTQNAWNHKGRAKASPLPMGVRSQRNSPRFQARITANKTVFHLGTFDTIEEASRVYQDKRRELFGQFA